MEAYYRACWICSKRFVSCGRGGANRRYCGPACAGGARQASKRAAQKRYRADDDVREQHRLDERERRRRRKLEAASRVGDQFSPGGGEPGTVALVRTETPVSMDLAGSGGGGVVAGREASAARMGAVRRAEPWTLIAPPELAVEAERFVRAGARLRCACCGRLGRIVRVVVRREPPWVRACRERLVSRLREAG